MTAALTASAHAVIAGGVPSGPLPRKRLGVVVWVGGMFFAYVCLRPVAAAQLPPPQRLPLWRCVFDLFLNWV